MQAVIESGIRCLQVYRAEALNEPRPKEALINFAVRPLMALGRASVNKVAAWELAREAVWLWCPHADASVLRTR